MAGRPKITPEQAEAIKRLANGGMKAGPIAAMMDCPQRIVEDIVAGRTWRSGLQNCTDCQKQLNHDNRSGLCAGCLKTRCCRCHEKLPADRRNRRCFRCKAEEQANRFARGDRLCCRCAAPLFERKDSFCRACRRAYHESRMLALGKEPGKPGRPKTKITGTCQVCREPSGSSLCRSCAALANTYGRPRVTKDTEHW